MNQKKINNEGYILILTLMFLSLLIIVVSSMFLNETAHSALSSTIIKREKAKMLALSGVQIALDKLTIRPDKKDKDAKDKDKKAEEKTKDDPNLNKKLLNKILPTLNRFQIIKLERSNDGIDGQINYCICCEQGKLNINYLYDFAKHKFLNETSSTLNTKSTTTAKKDPSGKAKADSQKSDNKKNDTRDDKKVLQEIFKKLNQLTGAKDLFNAFENFLQKRKYPLNDITELLEIPDFAYFNDKVFYQPDEKNLKNNKIYLTDIFTTWSNTDKIQPLLLSNSFAKILDLNKTIDGKDKLYEEIMKKLKSGIQWKTEWNKILKPLYGKDFDALIKGIDNLFDNQFSPKVFSVLSYGSIGDTIQKAYAIVEIDGNEAIAKIKKLYWI